MKKKIFSFVVLLISDLAVVFISFWFAHLIRSEILPYLYYKFKISPIPFVTFLNHFYMVSIWIFIFAYEKLYTKRYPFWEEVKTLLKSATISSSLIMIMIFIARRQIQFSRTIVVLAWFLSLFLFPLFRLLIKNLLLKLNIWNKKLIIIGVHETSLQALRSIKKNKTMGYEVLGFLDDDPTKIGKKFLGETVLGTISDLEKIVEAYKSKDIMVATTHLPRKKLKELLLKCESVSESMWIIPRTGDFITEGVEIEVLGEVLTLNIKRNLFKPWNILMKDLFDKFLTIILLIILSPLFFFIAVAIKLDSRGQVIFVQRRFGKRKKNFNLYKFRSMYTNSDEKLLEYLHKNPAAKKEWEKFKKLKYHDPRVTKVGRVIRKNSLDELPQLFNVIQGKMSLVGPRPYLQDELEGKELFKNTIARVKPGITGLWQISGRSELPFEERLGLDEYYIRNWSLWLDSTILLKSIKAWLSKKGAY